PAQRERGANAPHPLILSRCHRNRRAAESSVLDKWLRSQYTVMIIERNIMEEYRPVSHRTRLLFALVGLLTCLAGALCAEAALGRMRARALLRRYHVASLLFVTDPATTQTAIPVAPPPPADSELQR